MQTLVAIKRISHVIPRELNSHPLLSACKTHLPKNKFYLINQFTQTLHSLRFPNSSLIFIKFTTRKQQENTINSIPYLLEIAKSPLNSQQTEQEQSSQVLLKPSTESIGDGKREKSLQKSCIIAQRIL